MLSGTLLLRTWFWVTPTSMTGFSFWESIIKDIVDVIVMEGILQVFFGASQNVAGGAYRYVAVVKGPGGVLQ